MTKSSEQKDEVELAYLKIILDSLVQNRPSFQTHDVDLNEASLERLKNSVESALRSDSRIRKNTGIKVLNAFNVIIDNYGKYFKERV
jgi:hypothetical protein